MTRLLLPLGVLVLLGGCQHAPAPQPQTEQPVEEVVTVEPPAAEKWLENRLFLCQLSTAERREQLDQLAANAATADREAKFARLLLATCEPDLTPGLLREALSSVGDTQGWTAAEQALVQLVADLSRSYRILEEKNRQLADQLETTIRGIRAIETELDGMETNGVNP